MLLEKLDKYSRIIAASPFIPRDAAERTLAAVAQARAQSVTHLVIDLRAMQMEPRPSVTERYDFGNDIARAGVGMRKLAFVMNPAALGIYEFAFVVISNRGPRTAGFSSEPEAVAWLLGPDGAPPWFIGSPTQGTRGQGSQ